VIFEIDDLRIDMIDADDRMVLHMQQGDGYEHDSLVAWSKMVKPGLVALDIGAYTGLFSIIAKMRGADVVAFEPMPAQQFRLGINAKQNKVYVTVMPIAVSDRCSVMRLNYNQNVPLTTGAGLDANIDMHNSYFDVDCVSIDALKLKTVGAIKIDVERHEPCVLRGAMQTIERDRPSLLIETLDDDMRQEVLRLLPRYTVAAVLDKRNTMFTPL